MRVNLDFAVPTAAEVVKINKHFGIQNVSSDTLAPRSGQKIRDVCPLVQGGWGKKIRLGLLVTFESG